MIATLAELFFKGINSKNISFFVLLCITCLCGYFVFTIIQQVMGHNSSLINSLQGVNDKLSEIVNLLKLHEKSHR